GPGVGREARVDAFHQHRLVTRIDSACGQGRCRSEPDSKSAATRKKRQTTTIRVMAMLDHENDASPFSAPDKRPWSARVTQCALPDMERNENRVHNSSTLHRGAV